MEEARLLHMPHEVYAGIVWCLGVKDTAELAPCCRMFSQETTDAELWFQLFLRTCWPPSGALLAFAEGTTTPVGVDWRARLQVRMESSPTIVVDIGRGYTKWTVVHGVRGRWEPDGTAPQLVQLCSSPTHPPDCDRNEQLCYIHHRLDRELLSAAQDTSHPLHKTALGGDLKPGQYAVLEGRLVRLHNELKEGDTVLWQAESLQREPLKARPEQLAAVRRAHDLPILIGEPFVITANRGQGHTQMGQQWDCHIRAQLGNQRPGAVQVVSQAQMALWAHGIEHGIVVNIGQSQTIAVPVVRGAVVASCCASCSVGSADLTQIMVSLMVRKAPTVDSSLMTWCRDLKEAYCYVCPPGKGSLRARLAAGDDFGVQAVSVDLPDYANVRDTVELAEERVLVPEVLFDSTRGQGIPNIILQCADAALSDGKSSEDVSELLRNVVLVGGAADFPGIRPRVEYELRCLLQSSQYQRLSHCLESADDVYVLNPPLNFASMALVSPRFVPLFGGCVRAASSAGYGALERDTLGHLRQLPLQAEDLSETRGMRRMLALQLPQIFRTGGGGGEDDVVWQMFDDFDDIDLGDSRASPSSSSSENASECDSEPGPSRPKGRGKGRVKGRGKGRVWRPVLQ